MANKAIKILCLSIYLLFIAACSNSAGAGKDPADWTDSTVQILAMDTVMNITANGVNAETAVAAAEEKIYELESSLDVTDTSSEIYAINSSGGEPVTVSGQTVDIVTKALEISELTGGLYNIAMYPIIREWGFTTGDYKIPGGDTISALLQKIDYSQISIKDNSIAVQDGMAIDVGGIAKGFCGDMIRDILTAEGITSAIIDLGGDVQVMGTKPGGSDWRVAIQNPFGSGYLGIMSVTDTTVMTSGSYERFFTGDDGKVYHHLMDPETGSPSESGLVSVTIVTREGYRGDALATALFIMGVDEGTGFWRSRDDFDMILVTEDREVYITENLVDSFELTESFKNVSMTIIT